MEWQTSIDMYIVVVGAFLPLLMSVAKDLQWGGAAKKLLFAAFAFAASLGHLYFGEGVTLTDLPMTMLKVGVMMQGTYSWIWKPTGIDGKIAASVGVGSSKANE